MFASLPTNVRGAAAPQFAVVSIMNESKVRVYTVSNPLPRRSPNFYASLRTQKREAQGLNHVVVIQIIPGATERELYNTLYVGRLAPIRAPIPRRWLRGLKFTLLAISLVQEPQP